VYVFIRLVTGDRILHHPCSRSLVVWCMLAVVALTPNRMYISLCAALRRQSDPNWHAFFIRLDETPSDETIGAVLGTLSDPRLQLLRPASGANYTVRVMWWVIPLCSCSSVAP
jgi:hypothetical protein